MKYEDKSYSNDEDKAKLFGSILSLIFKENDNNDFDQQHKEYIDQFINENHKNLFITRSGDKLYDKDFDLNDLEEGLKNINKNASPGPDEINNQHLINLNQIGKIKLLDIINYSWQNSMVLEDWKLAHISMIEKKQMIVTIHRITDL